MKNIITLVLAITVVASSNPAFAAQSRIEAETPSGAVVTIPAHAVQVAPNVYSIGTAYDLDSDALVEGYMIVHKKNAKASPSGGKKGPNACYGYIASGAKWKNVEPWVLNPANTTLDGQWLLNNITGNIVKWEDATDGRLGNGGLDVLGNGNITNEFINPNFFDNINSVTFAPLENDIIAVNFAWGVWSGPEAKRVIVEWDQVFNTQYEWSDSGVAGKMDFENISTHELGHAFGLADLYTSSCSDETMFGYASLGEITKHTLNKGDITGIDLLY